MSKFTTNEMLKLFDYLKWENIIMREVDETDENGEPTGNTLYMFMQSAKPMTADGKEIPWDTRYCETFTREQLQKAGVWDSLVTIATYLRNKLKEQEGVI